MRFSTTYSTNLRLKYVPPVLVPPGMVGDLPNSADGCSYVLPINGDGKKTRQDYLGILQSYQDNFLWSGFLGAPEVADRQGASHWQVCEFQTYCTVVFP